MLSILFHLRPDQVGFQVLGRDAYNIVRLQARKSDLKLKQTPPIPTRIYSLFISAIMREMSEFESVLDRYLELVATCAQNPLMGRKRQTQYLIAKRLGRRLKKAEICPDLPELLEEYNLKEYFVAKGLSFEIKSGLMRGLSQIQLVAKLIIETFSGMREDEVRMLLYQCIETQQSLGRTHYIILGRTTKLNNGKAKEVRWITNHEGYRAILVSQKIAEVIYFRGQKTVADSESIPENLPLFVSNFHLGFSGRSLGEKAGTFKLLGIDLYHIEYHELYSRLKPTILDCDIQELEQIDPHRAWRSEYKFQVGKHWPLSNHQLRRSLALYAQRSGIVSLPSLRRQLKHITEEMARYYARGSAYAKNFIDDDKQHFGLDWQKTQPESAAISYCLHVLQSDDVLLGGHANWLNNRPNNTEEISLINREETIRRFKKGQIAYKETLLGGCTNVGECKQIAIRVLDVDCINGCTNLVMKLSNLKKIIRAQAQHINRLNTASVEYRQDKADLDILIAARDKALGQQSKSLEAT